MNGQPIPGFYYDPDKKKYFRIQKQHAVPTGVKYSADNIRKAEKKEKIQKAATARLRKTRKETIVRRHIDSLTQSCLDREIGLKRRSFYTQITWPNACMSYISHEPKQIVDRPSDAAIGYFDRDPISKTLYAVHGEAHLKRRRMQTYVSIPLPTRYAETEDYFDFLPLNSYSFEPWDELGRTTSTISSLTYMPASGALAATTYGSDRPPVVYLSDPDKDGPYVNQQFTPNACTSIWDAAARPTSFAPSPTIANSVAATHTEHLAVAASSSLLLFTRAQTGNWDCDVAQSLPYDILSLTWLSYTTLALGTRKGRVYIHDTRSGGASRVLTHPYPVTKVRRTDDPTRLVCAGLHDTLYLYDIRSPRPSTSHNNPEPDQLPVNHSRKKKRRRVHAEQASYFPSLPVFRILHSNPDDPDLDIAVHERLGLVAAAQDPSSSDVAIRVSSLWTGKTVKEIRDDRSGGFGKGGVWKGKRIRCLKWVDDENEREKQHGKEGVSLWSCWDGGIAKFGW